MHAFRLIFASLMLTAFIASPALAFTVDNTTGNNPDGTARFQDPDRGTPLGQPAGNQQQGGNFQLNMSDNNDVNANPFGYDYTQPSDAFKRAMENQQK